MDDDVTYHTDLSVSETVEPGENESGNWTHEFTDWGENTDDVGSTERPFTYRSEDGGGDDAQSAIVRFLHHAKSPQRSNRLLGRSALEVLRLVSARPSDVATVLNIVSSAAEDSVTVKCDILEFVPHMALMLSRDPTNEPLKALITSHLVPAVVKVLPDPDPLVRKMAENALLTMLKHSLVTGEYIEERVWHVIKGRMQTNPAVNSTIGVITIMSKLTPWVGSDVSIRLFVPLLIQLSLSPEFLIRRVSASIFGEICTVVGTQVTEATLLPCFLKLCADGVWGVRKTCAEVFMSVSCVCQLKTRKSRLAPAFASLLSDSCRWVQLAAFQSLGPFITTFAEPSITVLGYNPQGEFVLKHPHGFEFKLHSMRVEDEFSPLSIALMMDGGNTERGLPEPVDIAAMLGLSEDEDEEVSNNTSSSRILDQVQQCEPANEEIANSSSAIEPKTEVEESRVNGEIREDDCYNEFNYWREPVLNIDLNTDLADNKSTEDLKPQNFIAPLVSVLKELGIWKEPQAQDKQNQASEEESWKDSNEEIVQESFIEEVDPEETNSPESSLEVENESEEMDKSLPLTGVIQPPLVLMKKGKKQDIVPEELINHFVSMSDPKQDRSPDLAHHCAYNLPAVALTLGPDNWALLKGAYETLAADRQWKVRRIVASSIHELAVIVGEDVATQDLVPVFSGFIKDLDEVRIGALKHLAHFLKLLRPAGRNSFLPRLTEFLMTDYDWNWRFREELAEQLIQALGLFTPADTCHYLTPVVMTLLLDKVADVRKVAVCLVTELVNHVSIDVNLLRGLLAELAEQFAHSSRWSRRQTFALLCSRLVSERVLSEEMFASDVLPHLLDLSWDRVPNVRLAVARTLATDVMASPFLADVMNPHHEILLSVLKRLQGDKDRDVRYFAALPPREYTSMNYQNDSSSERRERLQRT